jgi:antitoxin component YwqK of YwqJK toxin-antitoxin module
MKKLLSILSICLVFISCSPDRVLQDELINKGTIESPLMYFEGKPFTGVAFAVHENGQLRSEFNYKAGKEDGLWSNWDDNGVLTDNGKSIDGYLSRYTTYFPNSEKHYEIYYSDTIGGLYDWDKLKKWDKDGQLLIEQGMSEYIFRKRNKDEKLLYTHEGITAYSICDWDTTDWFFRNCYYYYFFNETLVEMGFELEYP